MKKNLLFIIPEFYAGGAQHSLAKLTLELKNHYNIYICVFNNQHPPFFDYAGTLLSLDITGGKTLIEKVLNFYKRVKKIKNFKKQYDIDISISFLEGADYINLLSKRDEKVILSIRGSKFYDENIRGATGTLRRKILIPFLYKKADLIIALNYGIKYELKHFFGLKKMSIKVIYNFFDAESIREKSKQESVSNKIYETNRLTIAFHGRISKEKGVAHLLHIQKLIKKQGVDCQLVIIGDGKYLPKVLDLATHLNLTYRNETDNKEIQSRLPPNDPDIIFAGMMKNPYGLLKSGDIYCFPSHSEGFGNSLMEAMCLGIPVVAADCPWSPKEILSRSNQDYIEGFHSTKTAVYADFGLLLPNLVESKLNSNNYTIWANEIISLWNNKERMKEYSESAILRAGDFSKEKIIREWVDAIEQ